MRLQSGSLSGLASQSTARQGNILGMLGVGSGVLTSLAAVGFPPAVLAQFGMLAAAGGTVGSIIGRRITATELPQMVAGLWFLSLISHIRLTDFMTCSYSLALRRRSRCCPYVYWKRVGGCWSRIYASRMGPTCPQLSDIHLFLDFIACYRLSGRPRWRNHIHRIYRRLPETLWSHVIPTPCPAHEASR